MKILLVSEGHHELALGAAECPLGVLVERVLECEVEFKRMKVSDPAVRIHMPKGKSLAYERRALAWLKQAAHQGFNALVLLIDEDGDRDRIAGLTSAQQNAKLDLPRSMGVAVPSFDAWMLADEGALSVAFGRTIHRQPEPETTRSAKDAFRRLIEQFQPDKSQTELYLSIAKNLSIDLLVRRCPRGFDPFHERLRALLRA
jgi:hypothetical protein